jgi:hypothetical protein
MKVVLRKNHQNPPEIRQSRLKRDWMDGTYNKHAYKCLPLGAANVQGWEMVLQQEVVVQWDGGNTVPRVLSGETMTHTVNGQEYERAVVIPSIIGILSFATGWSMGTPPGYSTGISGSPNYFVDGAVPLTASIPTHWWPDEWNMNWKITVENTPVTFPKGMPFMFFQVYEESLLSEVEFEVEHLWDRPELMEERQEYGEVKFKNNQENPWTWMGSIRTGLNEKGEQIGPKHDGHPKLDVP